MRSWPVGGFTPPLSSQLKLKPNDARPVNTVLGNVALALGPGGRYPPPRPVHAASTATRMLATPTDIHRRRYPGTPMFMGPPSRQAGPPDGASDWLTPLPNPSGVPTRELVNPAGSRQFGD